MTVLDLHAPTGHEFFDPDVCVVGAGAVGMVLATELATRGRRVVVLEGGGRSFEACSQALYDSDVVGQPHDGVHSGRYRTYGGSTTRWSGQLLEFSDRDFEARHWIPGSGWPLRKSALAPYYARALTVEGMTGVEPDDERVWEQSSRMVPDLGNDIAPYVSRWTPEPNFVQLHGGALERSDRIAVYLHANVTRLSFDDGGRRIVSVECRTLDGRSAEFRAKSFVFCMGGIETVRFLLQPQRCPWQSHRMLGQHFQDRVAAICGDVHIRSRQAFASCFFDIWTRGWKYHPKFRLSPAAAEREALLDVTATMMFADDQDESTARAKATAKRALTRGPKGLSRAELLHAVRHGPDLALRAWHMKRYGRAYHPRATRVHLGVQCEQEPLGRSSIRLSSGRDATGLLRIAIDWRISDLELRTLATFVRVFGKSLDERGLATVRPNPELVSHLDGFRAQCHDEKHHMGGARMSTRPVDGIVDPNLRLHGTENGYVCSSAVFPSSGTANPTHTLIALAIRLADKLSGQSGKETTKEFELEATS